MNPTAEKHRRAIRIWLYAIAGLVVLMVAVGGMTRLTDSGLSIVEWRPVTGAMPPLSHVDWVAEFEKYKTSSEYQLANSGMTLDEFKRIYWWEWGHRILGRAIGVAFLLPLLFFLARGWIESRLKRRLWLIFVLGGLQGVVGWWMVASGLVNRVDVAQERLAIHLTTACLILIALVWTARDVAQIHFKGVPPRRLAPFAIAILVLLVGQIAFGGLVAGLKAGLVYDTWPQIDGAWIPASERLFFLNPVWTNFLDNHLTVQFTHRMTAYGLVLLAVAHAADCARCDSGAGRAYAFVLALILLIQTGLGITTLLRHVPVTLALVHQLVAMLAVIVATIHTNYLRRARVFATSPASRSRTREIDKPVPDASQQQDILA